MGERLIAQVNIDSKVYKTVINTVN